MIHLVIRNISSPDVVIDEDLDDARAVCFLLQLEIGADDAAGADVFDVVIATPEGLSEKAAEDQGGALSRRATIVLRHFAWSKVHLIVSDILRDSQADTWNESLLRLQRYFTWEYEDCVLETRQ